MIRYRRWVVGLACVLLVLIVSGWGVLLLATGWTPTQLFETAIPLCSGTTPCDPQIFHVGRHTVRVSAITTVTNDNGPAIVRVSIDDAAAIEFDSEFNYDTLMNVAPALTQWRWVDADWRPDLVLRFPREVSRAVYVGSADGQLHRFADAAPIPPDDALRAVLREFGETPQAWAADAFTARAHDLNADGRPEWFFYGPRADCNGSGNCTLAVAERGARDWTVVLWADGHPELDQVLPARHHGYADLQLWTVTRPQCAIHTVFSRDATAYRETAETGYYRATERGYAPVARDVYETCLAE